MDIICPKCGEPWDNDTIHERVAELNDDYSDEAQQASATYQSVAADFRRRGCAALGDRCSDLPQSAGPDGLTPAEAAATIYELLGDDLDGAAALLEDWEAGF